MKRGDFPVHALLAGLFTFTLTLKPTKQNPRLGVENDDVLVARG
jgi:hypothetical protein